MDEDQKGMMPEDQANSQSEEAAAPEMEAQAELAAPQGEDAQEETAEELASDEVAEEVASDEMSAEGAPVDEELETEDEPVSEEAELEPIDVADPEELEAESAPEPVAEWQQPEPAAQVATPAPERVEDPARFRDEEAPDFSQVPHVEGEHADGRAWYVVHCYSGYENKVRHNLEQRIESMGMKDLIFDVVVPTEEEIEVKEGKRRTVERRVFPGYILVNMVLGEESWYVVRNTPGVTSFVGQGNTPLPLRPEEVSQIVKRMEADAPRIKVTFKQGERVRIVDGPFNDFRGTVSEIDMERAKVRVMVNFFGRETPVELDFLQVEKA
jgi:transcriptional antiterminator NusG